MNKPAFAFTCIVSALLAGAACAQPKPDDHAAHHAAAAAAADLTDGEVRKLDKDNAKLTLKHAEIKSLDMPAMTMVFQVKDRAALDGLKVGDKVRFKAVNEAGKYTVTEIQVVP
ncbi:MAG TPA: copper-binding protein [Burkholderiaceae bacterium]